MVPLEELAEKNQFEPFTLYCLNLKGFSQLKQRLGGPFCTPVKIS